MREFYVYILASRTAVLYIGMTNDLLRRVREHKEKLVPGFSAKYHVNILVYFDCFPTAVQAIEAEKKLKGWTRAKKIALIESQNPTWRDLAESLASSPTRDPSRGTAQDDGAWAACAADANSIGSAASAR